MRAVILTTMSRGFASVCLPYLVEHARVEIPLVVLSEQAAKSRWRSHRRMARKVLRIGVLGALNGLRMRRWYSDAVAEQLGLADLETVTRAYSIPLKRIPTVNSGATVELLRQSAPDIGLALGSPYISRAIFSVPILGFLNVHHELLPEFRGAQSVIWQIYRGSRETGFTIHAVDERIDHGAILHKQSTPIVFRASVRETVTHNVARLWTDSAPALAELVAGLPDKLAAAQPQSGAGRSYTTPSFWQYLRVVRNHRRLANLGGR